jgi:hypothetical protein
MSDSTEIPTQISDFLRQVVVRQRRVALLRAVAMAITFALVWILAWSLVDRFVALAPRMRIAIDVINLAAIAALVIRQLSRVLRRRIDWLTAARMVDRHRPEMGQRLQTLVSQLLAPRELRGSQQLLDQIVGQATEQLSHVRPAQLVPLQAASGAWLIAVAATVAIAVLSLIPWLDLPTLIARQARPLAGIGAVSTTRLNVEPGNTSVVQGQPLTITARAQRLGGGTITLLLAPDGEPFSSQPMTRRSDERFTFATSDVSRDARYQVVGGDARSDVYSIRVLRRPAVLRFAIQYDYPAYLGQQPQRVVNTNGLIEAPPGTTATVEITATQPLRGAAFTIGPKRIGSTATTQPAIRVATFPVQESGSYRLQLTSRQGIGMSAPMIGSIRAIPDEAPTAKLLVPPALLSIPSDRAFSIAYRARDDHALASLELRVQVNESPPHAVPVAIIGNPRIQETSLVLDPSHFAAKAGDVMMLKLVASDRAKQQTTSESAYFYVAGQAPDADAVARAAALRSAALLAGSAAADLEHVRAQAEAAQQRGEIVVPNVARLAGAIESTDAIVRALMRATVQSDSPQLTTALSVLVDRSQALASDTSQVRAAAEQFVPPEKRAAQAAEISESARALRMSIETVWQGQQARVLLAQRQILEALSSKASPSTQPATMQRVREAISSSLSAGERDLGVHDADNILAQLKRRVADCDQFVAAQHPVDLSPPALQWSDAPQVQVGFAPRVRAACMVETVRPDGNAVRARDLYLASEAVRALSSAATTRPALADAKAYPQALASLFANNDAAASESARAQMRAWASLESSSDAISKAEGAALEANAASGAKDNLKVSRLSSLPTFACLFRPDEDQVAEQQREVTAGLGEIDPPEFHDALRAYFNALSRASVRENSQEKR